MGKRLIAFSEKKNTCVVSLENVSSHPCSIHTFQTILIIRGFFLPCLIFLVIVTWHLMHFFIR